MNRQNKIASPISGKKIFLSGDRFYFPTKIFVLLNNKCSTINRLPLNFVSKTIYQHQKPIEHKKTKKKTSKLIQPLTCKHNTFFRLRMAWKNIVSIAHHKSNIKMTSICQIEINFCFMYFKISSWLGRFTNQDYPKNAEWWLFINCFSVLFVW